MPDNTLDEKTKGNHYYGYKISPLDFMHQNQLPPIEASIIKYVLRHKRKNGADDLRKAKILINYLLEKDYGV